MTDDLRDIVAVETGAADDTLDQAVAKLQAADDAVVQAVNKRHGTRRTSGRPGGRRVTDLPPDFISVGDYAYTQSVDRRTVYKWIAQGLVESYQVGRILRVRNAPPSQECT